MHPKTDAIELIMNVDGVEYSIGEIPEIEWTVSSNANGAVNLGSGKACELTVAVKMSKWQYLKFKFFIWKAKLKAYHILIFKVKRGG